MSRELMIFDPDGLDGLSGDPMQINERINIYVNDAYENGPNSSDNPEPTAPVQAFIDSVNGLYLSAIVNANGRYCNFIGPGNPKYPDDWENTVISYYEGC